MEELTQNGWRSVILFSPHYILRFDALLENTVKIIPCLPTSIYHAEPDVLIQLITIHLVMRVSQFSQLHSQLHRNQQARGETAAVIRARLHSRLFLYYVLYSYTSMYIPTHSSMCVV